MDSISIAQGNFLLPQSCINNLALLNNLNELFNKYLSNDLFGIRLAAPYFTPQNLNPSFSGEGKMNMVNICRHLFDYHDLDSNRYKLIQKVLQELFNLQKNDQYLQIHFRDKIYQYDYIDKQSGHFNIDKQVKDYVAVYCIDNDQIVSDEYTDYDI